MGLAAKIAGALVSTGLAPGDRLAAQVEKSAEALALYAACVQAGVIFLPLNTAYTEEELAYFVEDSGAALLVCDASRETALKPVANRIGTRLATLNADGTGSLLDAAASQPPRIRHSRT